MSKESITVDGMVFVTAHAEFLKGWIETVKAVGEFEAVREIVSFMIGWLEECRLMARMTLNPKSYLAARQLDGIDIDERLTLLRSLCG